MAKEARSAGSAKAKQAEKAAAPEAPAVTAPAKPFTRYVEVPFSRWEFLKSFEVWVSVALLCSALYVILFSPSTMHVTTSQGMVMQSMKKKRARLASRTAAKEAPQAAMVYTDLVVMGIIGLATASFVHGCTRRIASAQARLEAKELEELRDAMYDPEVLAAKLKVVADDRKAWEEENASRLAKGRPKLRERRIVHAIAVNEVLTNFFVIVAIVMAIVIAAFVQMQSPNEARGLGAIIIILILVGAIVCPSFDPTLGLLFTYATVWQVLALGWLMAISFLTVRATWD